MRSSIAPVPYRNILSDHLYRYLTRVLSGSGDWWAACSSTESAITASTACCTTARSAPASISAPSNMSPATPAVASIQAWRRRSRRRDLGRQDRRHSRCRCSPPRRRARRRSASLRGESFKCRPVSHRGRHRHHGRRDEPCHHARKSAIHPCSYDDCPGCCSRSRRPSTRCRPATPTSTTSSVDRPRYEAELRLLGHGQIGGSGCEYDDQPASRGRRIGGQANRPAS